MDILKRTFFIVLILCLIFFIQYLLSQSNSNQLKSRISIDNAIKFPKDICINS